MGTNLLDITIDGELTGGKSTDHEKTGTNASIAATEAELLSNLNQTGSGALSGSTLGLVNLGQHGVGGLGHESGGETGNETRAEIDGGQGTAGGIGLVNVAEYEFRDLLEDDELGHGVRDPTCVVSPAKYQLNAKEHLLLEENGAEAGVESTKTLILQDLSKAREKAAGIGRLGNETDTGSLERAESDVGKELGESRGGEVDGSTVLRGSLVAKVVDALLLEEFISTELEGALEEVSSGGRTETSPDGTSTLTGDDLLETSDEALVVL